MRLTASGAYVWRAAVTAALFNLLLNPGVAWVTGRGRDFLPVPRLGLYVAVLSVGMSLLVSVLGARRVRREVEARHHTPTGGTAWEEELLAHLPANPAAFGVLLGLAATMAALVVFTVAGALGFSGFSIATFSIVVSAYSGALAFVVMRWTILRQLMELAPVG